MIKQGRGIDGRTADILDIVGSGSEFAMHW